MLLHDSIGKMHLKRVNANPKHYQVFLLFHFHFRLCDRQLRSNSGSLRYSSWRKEREKLAANNTRRIRSYLFSIQTLSCWARATELWACDYFSIARRHSSNLLNHDRSAKFIKVHNVLRLVRGVFDMDRPNNSDDFHLQTWQKALGGEEARRKAAGAVG